MYDLVIVGSGPTGLALAQRLAFADNALKILIVDSHDSVGGCHRVERVGLPQDASPANIKFFTEHGPRVYSSSYKTFKNLLKQINLDFGDLFTPYKFTISAIGGQTIFRTLSGRELFRLFLEFGKLVIDPSHGSDTTMAVFMANRFSARSKDLVDRVCRLTDGGGADKFSLNEFLELFNQQAFYGLYQPRAPNDVGLMRAWRAALERTGKVTFLLNRRAQNLVYDKNTNRVTHLGLAPLQKGAPARVAAGRFVLAVPPRAIAQVLGASAPEVQNCFKPLAELRRFADETDYDTYISITFHWRSRPGLPDVDLPDVYGFPWSEWGIIFVKLTDYMPIENSRTVISAAVSLLDRVSSRTGKTANQSSAQEVVEEVQFQLSETFKVLAANRPGHRPPDFSIISPTNYYDAADKKWKSTDTAFISTSQSKGLPQTGAIANLYNAGTHNKLSRYKFTTLESAVQNGCILANRMYGGVELETSDVFTIRTALLIVLILIIIVFIAYFMVKWKTPKTPTK